MSLTESNEDCELAEGNIGIMEDGKNGGIAHLTVGKIGIKRKT